jgi:shikimate dehydrogenase
VTLLGAGGTARAALAAVSRVGSGTVTICVRRREAGADLAAVAHGLGLRTEVRGWAEASALLGTDVVISTVPRGVADHLGVAGTRWRPGGVVFDVVYDPWPTPLASAAAEAGCRVASGLDLLLAQAVGQFERFTGVPAPVEAMRAALVEARPAR